MAEDLLYRRSNLNMAANPLEVYNTSPGHYNSDITGLSRPERRKRVRFRVHWPLLLRKEGQDTEETTTQDLSSEGFYCLSKQTFTVGETVSCALQIPTNDHGGKNSYLVCRVLIVRVEERASGGEYGIACRTQDYRFGIGW